MMVVLSRSFSGFIILFSLANVLLAQDTLQLKDLVIIGHRLQNFNTGHHVEKFDSTLTENQEHINLADFLSRHSTVFIRNYGPGTLATSSVRGAGASHTAVLWNGFNLQSPMNGQLDFALLPMSLVDNVELQKGGSGALFGSGAVGGIIHMNNSPQFNSGLKVRKRFSAGSFGNYQQGVNTSYGSDKYYGAIKLFYHHAENDFPYKNITVFGSPEVRQRNNGLKQYGLLAQNHLKLNRHNNLHFHFWYQNNFREIPPPMTAGATTANQHDEFYRITSEWQRVAEKYELFVRSAYFNNNLVFNEPNIGHQSRSFSQSLITETEARWYLSQNFHVNSGLNYTFHYATSGGYGSSAAEQIRLAGFTSLKFLNKLQTFKGTLNIRQEFVEGRPVPVIPSLGIEYLVLRNYTINGNISRTYRIPTFNDLFWKSAGARGNPALKEESGVTGEAGVTYHATMQGQTFYYSTKVYANLIDNWINWEQVEGIWMPRNIMQVMARGIETSAGYEKQVYRTTLRSRVNYSFTQSTVMASSQQSNIGTQLMYVPYHTGNARFEVLYRSLGVAFNQSYTGSRFTNTDNTRSLPHFTLANIQLHVNVPVESYEMRLSGEIHNFFNTSYQVIPFQAMPGRNYQLTINFSYNKSKLK